MAKAGELIRTVGLGNPHYCTFFFAVVFWDYSEPALSFSLFCLRKHHYSMLGIAHQWNYSGLWKCTREESGNYAQPCSEDRRQSVGSPDSDQLLKSPCWTQNSLATKIYLPHLLLMHLFLSWERAKLWRLRTSMLRNLSAQHARLDCGTRRSHYPQ